MAGIRRAQPVPDPASAAGQWAIKAVEPDVTEDVGQGATVGLEQRAHGGREDPREEVVCEEQAVSESHQSPYGAGDSAVKVVGLEVEVGEAFEGSER